MFKIYPSAIAPVLGITTNGYKEGCPRFFYGSSLHDIPRIEIPALYRYVGGLEEMRMNALLQAQYPTADFNTEVSFKHQLTPNIIISGRVDAVAYGPDAQPLWIHETKATVSRAKYSQIIRKHEVDEKHLSQLITYMSMMKVTHATLSVGYYHLTRAYELNIASTQFNIRLTSSGVIFVDGQPYTKTASEILVFYRILAEAINGFPLPPPTINKKACESCPFRVACAKSPKSKAEFNRYISITGTEQPEPGYIPTLNVHNIRS